MFFIYLQKTRATRYFDIFFCLTSLTLKDTSSSIWSLPYSFSKNSSSRERVRPCYLVTFNIIISHIFSENFIKIRHIVQKIWRFCPSILTIFIEFSDFLTFPCYKGKILETGKGMEKSTKSKCLFKNAMNMRFKMKTLLSIKYMLTFKNKWTK